MANQKFEEIDVERINVREPDGTLRMVIANNARMPDPLLEGTEQDRTGTRGGGLMFFNDQGFEVGGLTFAGNAGNGGTTLTFDRFGQDQCVFLGYHEQGGRYTTMLGLMDRPDEPLTETIRKASAIDAMPDGDEKLEAMMDLAGEHAQRLDIRRAFDGEVAINLMDKKGRPRIRLAVGANDEPRIEFLDATGNVTFSLPPEGS